MQDTSSELDKEDRERERQLDNIVMSVNYCACYTHDAEKSANDGTRHRASTSTRWHFAFSLCCHSNETRTPIANPPNSAQLGGTYMRVRAVCGEGKTHTQRHTQTRVTNIHFAPSTTHAKCRPLITCKSVLHNVYSLQRAERHRRGRVNGQRSRLGPRRMRRCR